MRRLLSLLRRMPLCFVALVLVEAPCLADLNLPGNLRIGGHIYQGQYGVTGASQTVFSVLDYGAKHNGAQFTVTINSDGAHGGQVACGGTTPSNYTGPGISSCNNLTSAAYAGTDVYLTNAVENAMNAGLAGTTLASAITSTTQTSIVLTAPSGTHWQSILPSGSGEMLIDSELIAYSSVSTDTFTVPSSTPGSGRAVEGTTAATHSAGATVHIGGFDLVDAGAYTAVRSYSWPWHEWDAGDKLVIPARGWTYTAPGVFQGPDPSAITGANETAWYGEFLPRATSVGTNQIGSWFTPGVGTVATVSGTAPNTTLTFSNFTVSTNIVDQVEVATLGTDDTASAQAAINAASAAGGGVVVFPAGCYILNGTLNLASHVHVRAQGAIFLQNGSAIAPFKNYNGGDDGGSTMISAAGTLSADDPQMSTFSYNSGIVAPVQYAAGGSCSETTTYYYKVSGLTASGQETALSSTMNFGRPSGGNDKIEVSLLQSPYPVIVQYHVWRSDGVDTNGNYVWKLWRTVNSKWNASPQANEWTVGYSHLLGLVDDCTTFAPDATKAIPAASALVSTLTDIAWDGGSFFGNNGCSKVFFIDLAQDVRLRNVEVQDAGDVGIKLARVNEGSIEHTRITNCAHGVVLENCQHVVSDTNKILASSVAPALNYHDQAFAVASKAHSTGNPFDYGIIWRSNEITTSCRDYGVHCQGLQNYGAFRLTLDNNFVHDLYGDPNDATYGAHGSIWSPAVTHGLPQSMRFRDSSGIAQNNRIENPNGYGILVDNILDFSDQIENGDDLNAYNDRPLVGGNVDLMNNTVKGALLYAVHVANSSPSVPTASVTVPTDTGTYSTSPVSAGALLTQMDSYATGHAFAPALISPCRVNENTLLDTGVQARSQTNDAIEYYTSGGTIGHNRIDGVVSAGVYLGFATVNGSTVQPIGTEVSGNSIHNLGYGTGGGIVNKVGIYSMQQSPTIADNVITAQDSGTLSSSIGIALGYDTGSPYNANDYSATLSGNRFVNVATPIQYKAAAGHHATGGDNYGFRRQVSNGGTALATTNFGTLTGFGTASVTAASGTDSAGSVTITVTSTSGAAANPSVILTFVDGAWPAAPNILATLDSTSTGTKLPVMATASTTAATLALEGTIAATGTYILHWWAVQ